MEPEIVKTHPNCNAVIDVLFTIRISRDSVAVVPAVKVDLPTCGGRQNSVRMQNRTKWPCGGN